MIKHHPVEALGPHIDWREHSLLNNSQFPQEDLAAAAHVHICLVSTYTRHAHDWLTEAICCSNGSSSLCHGCQVDCSTVLTQVIPGQGRVGIAIVRLPVCTEADVCIQSVSRVTTALAAKLDMSKIQLHMAECVSKSWKGYETCECALRMGSLTVMMAASRLRSPRVAAAA